MEREEKIVWMATWAAKNGFQLMLKGEIGFGRPCVGICSDGHYPEYHWYDDDYNQVDENGDVWTPDDAYHKGPYVAVLGQSEETEDQLYHWLKWFDKNGFVKETGELELDPTIPVAISLALGQDRYVRLIKKNSNAN